MAVIAGGGSGVAKHVEGVGALAHLFGQESHLGVAAGVVGNGAESVGGQRHAKCRQHADGRKADAVDAGRKVAESACKAERGQDSERDDDHGQPRAEHADGYAFDDGGGTALLCLLRDAACGFIFVGGEIFCALANYDAGHQTCCD